MMNSSKRAMQITLGVIIPVAVILVVVASALAQELPRTELLNSPSTIFLPFVTNNNSGSSDTSFELIEQALSRGEIDEETALVYKVFAVYLDQRLPERFIGDDSQVRDTRITAEVLARWSSLSPTTQALLEPFLLPPAAPGSWLELQQEQAVTAQSAVPIEWVTLSRPGGKVKVWYQTRYPGDDVLAAQILVDMEDIVWPKLFKLMDRAPLPDDKLPEYVDNGGDGLFDIYLVRISAHGEAHPYPPGCKKDPSYVLVNGMSPVLRGTLAHEFMHAILYSYDVKAECQEPEYNWLHEATATWAEDYISSDGYDTRNSEHVYAHMLLDHTEQPLETSDEKHEYGAYLWPFYLARTFQPEIVRTIWDATEGLKGKYSLAAIDLAITNSGGFLEQWPKFAELNLNQEPIDQYYQWDGLMSAAKFSRISPVTLPEGGGEKKITMEADVPHLAARYYDFSFSDPQVSKVRYENADRFFTGAEPRAHVEALIKIEGQEWTTEDWTSLPEREFCRTKPDERIEELVIIFSNSEWENRNHVLDPGTPSPTLWFNDTPCSCEGLSAVQNWTGQVNFSFTTAGSSGGESISYNHSATVNLVMGPSYQNSDYIMWQDVSLGGTGEVNDVHTDSPDFIETLVGSGALYPGGPTQDDPSASLGVWLPTCTFEFHLQTGMPAQHSVYGETYTVSTGVGFMDINDIPANQLTGSRTVTAVYYPIDEPSWFVPGGVMDWDLEQILGDNFGAATVSWSFEPAD